MYDCMYDCMYFVLYGMHMYVTAIIFTWINATPCICSILTAVLHSYRYNLSTKFNIKFNVINTMALSLNKYLYACVQYCSYVVQK